MQRDELVDALRGFALFGILAVNIQCFVGGMSAPSLGILDAQSSAADHVVVLLTAFMLEFKFYPLFSFCFGYGFAVQARRWKIAGVAPGPRFTRRMNAMLFIGVLHGGLLWFGDILTRYALGGYLLRFHAGTGPKKLLAALRFWFVAALLVISFTAAMLTAGSIDVPADLLAQEIAARADIARESGAYKQGSYLEATRQRINDYLIVTSGFIMLASQFMVLFLAGALTAQLRLLRGYERHREFWKGMLRFGLYAGLPLNVLYAWLQWQISQHPGAALAYPVTTMLMGDFAPILSIALIAALVLHRGSGIGQSLVRLFAPAGRYALTLYVSQSVLMALLLNGFGLGLGAHASPATLLLWATAIYLSLLAASHIMQRYAIPGPLETLWRRYTYRQ